MIGAESLLITALLGAGFIALRMINARLTLKRDAALSHTHQGKPVPAISYSYPGVDARDLVSPQWFGLRGQAAILRLHPDLVKGWIALKAVFPDLSVNTWALDPKGRVASGLRSQDQKIGASLSDHRVGGALDLHHPALDKVLAYIRAHHAELGVTAIEDPAATLPRGWLHASWVFGPKGSFAIIPVSKSSK